MNKSRKLSWILLILMIILSSLILLIPKVTKEEQENSINTEIDTPKHDETIVDYSDSIDDKEIENKSNLDIIDRSKKIESLSDDENKVVRDIAINFINTYGNYYNEDEVNIEDRVNNRLDNIKSIMSEELYDNLYNLVKTESSMLGIDYVYSKINRIGIYEVVKNDDSIDIGLTTWSTYFDISMNPQVVDIQQDYKFKLSKVDNTWIVNDFFENFK